MSYQEFVLWLKYFERRPEGWKEDLRAFKIMCASGNIKGQPGDIFPSLAVVKHDQNSIPAKGTVMHNLMKNAKNGDDVPFLKELLG